MKRLLSVLTLLFGLLFTGSSLSSKSVKELWLEMPDSIIGYLTKTQRISLCDAFEFQDENTIKNQLGGTSQIKQLTADHMQVMLNGSTSLQLGLLPNAEGDSVVCMIKTFQSAESTIELYDQQWQRLKDFRPTLQQLLVRPDTMTQATFDSLKANIDPILIRATLDNDEKALLLNLSLPFLGETERKQMENICLQKKLKWDGETFN